MCRPCDIVLPCVLYGRKPVFNIVCESIFGLSRYYRSVSGQSCSRVPKCIYGPWNTLCTIVSCYIVTALSRLHASMWRPRENPALLCVYGRNLVIYCVSALAKHRYTRRVRVVLTAVVQQSIHSPRPRRSHFELGPRPAAHSFFLLFPK